VTRGGGPPSRGDLEAATAGAVTPQLDPGERIVVSAWAIDRSQPAGFAEVLLGSLARTRRRYVVVLTDRRLLVFRAAPGGPGSEGPGSLAGPGPDLDEPRSGLRTVASRRYFGWTVVELIRAGGGLRRFDFPKGFQAEAEAIRDAFSPRTRGRGEGDPRAGSW
jgi:hypothetical protein